MSTGRPAEIEMDFEASENDGIEAYTFAEKVKQRVSMLGVGNHKRPKLAEDHVSIYPGEKAGNYFEGKLPSVIRKLDLDQLSALYSLYSNWYGYLTTQTMLVAAERSEAIRQRDFLKRHLKNHYRNRINPETNKKFPEASILDFAEADKRFIQANATYEQHNALYEILDAMRKVADQDMKVISREVTIQQEKLRKELFLQGFGKRGQDTEFEAALGDEDYGSTNDQAQRPPPSRPKREVKRYAGGPGKPRVQGKPRGR